jgi:hypothetical protein
MSAERTPLLLTLPFDQEIRTFDQAAAWARLVERGLREMRYRKRDDAPALREVSLVETLPEPQGAEVIALDPWSRKVAT